MSTTSTSSSAISFYDIAMRQPVEKTCCSPNPWKARLALNFKKVPYTTNWVPLPDIAKVRSSLKVPACRKFADGSDFYTLPVIEDPSTNSLVGDSYDIAVYLQKTYPTSGAGDLFPAQTLDYTYKPDLEILIPLSDWSGSEFPEYAKFNANVDAAFTSHTLLAVTGFPFDPAWAETSKAEFVRRAGVSRWEDFVLAPDARRKTLDSLRDMLAGLAPLFRKDESGPFLRGKDACYADLIVGGWLRMFRATLPESEWEELKGWHDGLFGRFSDALEAYAEVK